MSKWFQIFRTGTHTDSKGRTISYTTADLDKIVSQYKPDEFKAPITIGHPTSDKEPAYGWIKQVKRIGEKLMALPEKIVPEFAEAVKKGMFTNRSSGFGADLSLRHVAFLGAVPPAVKGMGEVEFSSNEENYSVDLNDVDAEKETLLSEKLELEEQVESLTNTKNELQQYKDNNQALEQKFADTEALRKTAEDNLRELNMKIRFNEFKVFLNERIAYGNLTPKLQASAQNILEALDTVQLKQHEGADVFEFSDKTKANPVDLFKEFLAALPKMVEFKELTTKQEAGEGETDVDVSEYADKNVDADRLELHKKAKAYQKQHNCSYETALKEISK